MRYSDRERARRRQTTTSTINACASLESTSELCACLAGLSLSARWTVRHSCEPCSSAHSRYADCTGLPDWTPWSFVNVSSEITTARIRWFWQRTNFSEVPLSRASTMRLSSPSLHARCAARRWKPPLLPSLLLRVVTLPHGLIRLGEDA